MTLWLLAASLATAAVPPGLNDPKPYGVLLIAADVDVAWRKELGSLRSQIKGHAVESVVSADRITLQRAIDKLVAQRVTKIIAIPIETVSAAGWLSQVRYLFGVNPEPGLDRPGPSTSGDIAGRPIPKIHAEKKATLKLPSASGKRLASSVPLVLGPTMDQSPLLVDILADRAKALSQNPSHESLVLVALAPRSDQSLKSWTAAVQEIANQVGEKAGFRKALAIGVRDGVRAGQQDSDRTSIKTKMRALVREGRITVIPLSPQSERSYSLLRKSTGGSVAFHWNGRGIQGDRRLLEWLKATLEQSTDGSNTSNDVLSQKSGGQQ